MAAGTATAAPHVHDPGELTRTGGAGAGARGASHWLTAAPLKCSFTSCSPRPREQHQVIRHVKHGRTSTSVRHGRELFLTRRLKPWFHPSVQFSLGGIRTWFSLVRV